MTTPGYEESVWSGVDEDWTAQGDQQTQLVEIPGRKRDKVVEDGR